MKDKDKEKSPGSLLQEQLGKKWELAWKDLSDEDTIKV